MGWKTIFAYQLIKCGKKKCKKCKKWKKVCEYRKDTRMVSGCRTVCIKCGVPDRIIRGRKRKQGVVDAYGGKCACCGETKLEFLSLEHINRDGGLRREEIKIARMSGEIIGGQYDWLKKQGWPKKGLTILCMNCNFAKRFGNPCPHSIEHKLWLNNFNQELRGK